MCNERGSDVREGRIRYAVDCPTEGLERKRRWFSNGKLFMWTIAVNDHKKKWPMQLFDLMTTASPQSDTYTGWEAD